MVLRNPKPSLTPLPDALCKILETWFWGHYSATEIKNEQAKCKRPSNATAVIPCQINKELYHSIAQTGKFLDRPFRYIQNALGKGAQPLASVWYKIIQCETAVKKQNPDKLAVLSIGPGLDLDFAEIRQLLDLSLRLLGMASAELAIQRRSDLQCFIVPAFQKLCKGHVSFTRWMFGENVKAQIEDTTKINRMVESANKTLDPSNAFRSLRKSFLAKKLGERGNRERGTSRGRLRGSRGGGRGRGRSFNQYSSPQ